MLNVSEMLDDELGMLDGHSRSDRCIQKHKTGLTDSL